MLTSVNLEKKLEAARRARKPENDLQALLDDHAIHSSQKEQPENNLELNKLEPGRIYHRNDIRKICIDYRLRFLDLKYFKPELPDSALEAIDQLEEQHNAKLDTFKIMAPSRLFKLEDKDDPLLFAPLGNGYYYLIHRWGKDLHPLRKLLVWPFRNVVNLIMVVLAFSLLATLGVPEGLFSKKGGSAEFWIIFFFIFKSLVAVVIFYGFALGKNFNPFIWNSRFFNA